MKISQFMRRTFLCNQIDKTFAVILIQHTSTIHKEFFTFLKKSTLFFYIIK